MIHGYLVLQKRDGSDGPLFPVKGDVKIGRGTQCDVRIHVQSVSNQHCQIFVGPGRKAHIFNLSSNLPTLVNGLPIGKGGCQLKNEDIVTVGERSFWWYSGQQKPSKNGKKSVKKRRKSEADSMVGSHNVAIVNPLFHKRRTLGPTASWSSVRSPVDVKQGSTSKSSSKDKNLETSSTPASVKTPSASRASARLPAPDTPSAKTPTVKSHVSRTQSAINSNKSPAIRTPAGKSPSAKTPATKATNTPAAKTPVPKTPVPKTPVAKTPVAKTPVPKTPVLKTPVAKTPVPKTPVAKTPVPKTPVAKTPVAKTPVPKTPVPKTPVANTPVHKTPAPKTPAAFNTPASKTPSAKSSAVKSPSVSVTKTPSTRSPAAKTPAAKSSAAKARKSLKTPLTPKSVKSSAAKARKSLKTPLTPKSAKSSAAKARKSLKTPLTPKSAKSKSARKSKSAVASLKRSKAQKRRLSSPGSVVSKRVKIESPKSIDKKKMAALSGIHRKSLTVVSSSTLSNVRVILSARKTPIVKAIKTPRSSTVKKMTSIPPKSSSKKPRRPLFSEILKKKAVQTANAVAKKLTVASKDTLKAKKLKVKKNVLSTEIPAKFSFTSTTGHANSPESIFIGRKVVKTPALTRKGRKDPLFLTHQNVKGNLDLSGVSEIFKTPAKVKSQHNSDMFSSIQQSVESDVSRKSRKMSSAFSPMKAKNSKSLMKSPRSSRGSPAKLSPKSPVGKEMSAESSRTRSSRNNSLNEEKISSPSMSKRMSSLSSSASKHSVQLSRGSSAKKHWCLLTSTPAPPSRRQSSDGSVFESPSSVLTGFECAQQSPPSGRKSRLDIVSPKSTYVHSPHASPVKSSLKSSPPRSPPSGGHGKGLSVSFNDSIRVQMLLAGSRKGPNMTAVLGSPISPPSEGRRSTATPDVTTFDFNSIKTPNVPNEMFVSSILSSGASSNSQASGSAKRKGRSPQNNVGNLQVRRLLKSSASPAGYVDVKGVKRLMAAACKTPTYLAVEGVKKLFGDAAASASNELSNFAGVRELFASPSPKVRHTGRLSNVITPEEPTSPSPSKKSSPVAKILAEVEGRKTPNFSPPSHSIIDKLSPKSSTPASKRGRNAEALTKESSPGQKLNMTPAKRVSGRKSSSSMSPKPKLSSSPRLSQAAVEEVPSSKRTRAGRKVPSKAQVSKKLPAEETSPQGKPTRRQMRKAAEVPTPSADEVKPAPVNSPPKRSTRRAAKPASSDVSPIRELPKTRRGRGAKAVSPSVTEALPSSRKTSKKATQANKETKKTSPAKESSKISQRSPSTSRESPGKASPVKTTSVAEAPQRRRNTRRGAALMTSPTAKSSKRALSPSEAEVVSPAKKSKKDKVETLSPKNSTPVRATRRTKRDVSSKREKASPELTLGRKKKVVTFDEHKETPDKKGRTSVSKKRGSAAVKEESVDVSPVKSKRAKKTDKDVSTHQEKKTTKKTTKKSSSPIKSLSPRRTRSRK